MQDKKQVASCEMEKQSAGQPVGGNTNIVMSDE